MSFARYCIIFVLCAGCLHAAGDDPASAAFDAANKLYEQGKYTEAAMAYEQLVPSRRQSDSLLFNLGNAWFKAGQTGRAIAAWRQAGRLAPRDPNIRFNLQFARKKVSGVETAPGSFWERTLAALTINEWTALSGVALWLCFGLLALREWRPTLRPALGSWALAAGIAALLVVGCAVNAAMLSKTAAAVVIVPEAIARSGPLEEAKVLHQFRDGAELTVLDQKDLSAGGQKQSWLRVRDAGRREGWLKSDQMIVLRPGVD